MDAADFKIVAPPEAIRPFARRYLYANRRLSSPLTLRPKPTGYSYLSNFFGGREATMARSMEDGSIVSSVGTCSGRLSITPSSFATKRASRSSSAS